jgi:hypothetical protein
MLLALCGIGKSDRRGKVVSKAFFSERILQVANTQVNLNPIYGIIKQQN